jgi:hypothetical protein
MDKKVGEYSFIVGVVIAIVLGLFAAQIKDPINGILVSLLVILGLVVGFLNVAGKETKDFLAVGVMLLITAYVGGAIGLAKVMYVGMYLAGIFNNLVAFAAPAIVIVALKEVLRLAK